MKRRSVSISRIAHQRECPLHALAVGKNLLEALLDVGDIRFRRVSHQP